MTPFTGRDWIVSVTAFAASVTALRLAMQLGLGGPYWAMTVHRSLCTVLGAVGAVALVPALDLARPCSAWPSLRGRGRVRPFP